MLFSYFQKKTFQLCCNRVEVNDKWVEGVEDIDNGSDDYGTRKHVGEGLALLSASHLPVI